MERTDYSQVAQQRTTEDTESHTYYSLTENNVYTDHHNLQQTQENLRIDRSVACQLISFVSLWAGEG